MNKTIITKILVICILSITIFSINTNCYALGNIINGADDFISAGNGNNPIDENNLKTISDIIYNILFIAAVAVAVVVAAVLGIQFMLGSMEEKAKIKEALYPFIIGCICVFGAFGIWKLVASVFEGL